MHLFSDGIHLISNLGINHLHEYCQSIGIKHCWYHSSSKFKHYDIPKLKRATFFLIHPEVKKVSSREIVKILKGLDVSK
jgi:hypothetical protein